MASPVFLSYRWNEGVPPTEVEMLDREMRLRGVPVWRDIRELGPGALNEEVADNAIRHICTGCVLYFTEAVLESWFIKSVELSAVRSRIERDGSFFVAAIFDGVGSEESEILRREIGINLTNYQGLFVNQNVDFQAQIHPFSAQILSRYLSSVPVNRAAVALNTWNQIPLNEPATLHLNWAREENTDAGPLPVDWRLLKKAAHDLQTVLSNFADTRVLRVEGNAHLSAAFLLGYTFREPTGWRIEAHHGRAPVEIASVEANRQGWRLVPLPAQNDSGELVIKLCASAECGNAVQRHRSRDREARVEIGIFPPDGKPDRTSLDDIEIDGLAAAVVSAIREARERYSIAQTELYFACPWTLGMALGWNFASSGPVSVYEATAAKDTYHPDPLQLP
jgi:hypothetical protein